MKLSLCFVVALPLLLNSASLENEKRVIFKDFNLGRKHYIFCSVFFTSYNNSNTIILLIFIIIITITMIMVLILILIILIIIIIIIIII